MKPFQQQRNKVFSRKHPPSEEMSEMTPLLTLTRLVLWSTAARFGDVEAVTWI